MILFSGLIAGTGDVNYLTLDSLYLMESWFLYAQDLDQANPYCPGRKFVKVLMQDSALLHGVIAYAITQYHAG